MKDVKVCDVSDCECMSACVRACVNIPEPGSGYRIENGAADDAEERATHTSVDANAGANATASRMIDPTGVRSSYGCMLLLHVRA